MNQSQIKKIKEQTETFFKKASFVPLSVIVAEKEGVIKVDVKVEDPKLLIGERGVILLDAQRILKLIILKDIKEPYFVDLDINEYKAKKTEALKELARQIADEVSLSGQKKVLEPMRPYERRIIHLELEKREDVITDSIGDEPERRLVVLPAKVIGV